MTFFEQRILSTSPFIHFSVLFKLNNFICVWLNINTKTPIRPTFNTLNTFLLSQNTRRTHVTRQIWKPKSKLFKKCIQRKNWVELLLSNGSLTFGSNPYEPAENSMQCYKSTGLPLSHKAKMIFGQRSNRSIAKFYTILRNPTKKHIHTSKKNTKTTTNSWTGGSTKL